MTTVIIKKKNGRLVRRTIDVSRRAKSTPEMIKALNQEIEARKKLVPNKIKRIEVAKLANAKSITFDEALKIINETENELRAKCENKESATINQKKATKEEKKRIRKSRRKASKLFKLKSNQKKVKNKYWVSIVSGGGGPGTGKKR